MKKGSVCCPGVLRLVLSADYSFVVLTRYTPGSSVGS